MGRAGYQRRAMRKAIKYQAAVRQGWRQAIRVQCYPAPVGKHPGEVWDASVAGAEDSAA